LKDAIDLLASAARTKRIWWSEHETYVSFKLNFITLTLPSKQIHTDTEIAHLILKPFIRWWREKNPNLLYIWKAEVQDNGNIHYHLTTNSFIHWRTLRKQWNRRCEALGYVSRSTSSDPNSTDVHAVKNIKNISAYLSAYVTKKDLYSRSLKRYHKIYGIRLKAATREECILPRNYFKRLKRKVTSKIYDCSKALLIPLPRVQMCWEKIDNDISQMKADTLHVRVLDYCKIISTTTREWPAPTYLASVWRQHTMMLRKMCKESLPLYEQ
jgi:hypothetical protein